MVRSPTVAFCAACTQHAAQAAAGDERLDVACQASTAKLNESASSVPAFPAAFTGKVDGPLYSKSEDDRRQASICIVFPEQKSARSAAENDGVGEPLESRYWS